MIDTDKFMLVVNLLRQYNFKQNPPVINEKRKKKYLQYNISKFLPNNSCTKNWAKEVTMRTRFKPKVPCNTVKSKFMQI